MEAARRAASAMASDAAISNQGGASSRWFRVRTSPRDACSETWKGHPEESLSPPKRAFRLRGRCRSTRAAVASMTMNGIGSPSWPSSDGATSESAPGEPDSQQGIIGETVVTVTDDLETGLTKVNKYYGGTAPTSWRTWAALSAQWASA